MQEHIWEKEYRNPRLITKESEPQAAVLDFLKFLKKKEKITLEGLRVLDLGCGTGRNSNYIANLGNSAVGIDISETALKLARERAAELHLNSVSYIKQSIGSAFSFPDSSFDIALDVTSSNSLNEAERTVYLQETARVLKSGGYLFVRALCKDGDKNAKELLKRNPGPEKDTYIMPEFGLIERIFSKEDFIAAYFPFFEILELEKIAHYSKFDGRIFKRNYWLAYLKKK
jgi:ubiquinone/menaquinone biosynthesis C-methylase UbiE